MTPFIPIFLTFLAQCLKSSGTAASPKSALLAHYGPQDDGTEGFDPEFVASLRGHARRANRRAGGGHLTRPELDAKTVEALEHARTQDDATVTAFVASAPPAELSDTDN